jgi:hypothetical protein
MKAHADTCAAGRCCPDQKSRVSNSSCTAGVGRRAARRSVCAAASALNHKSNNHPLSRLASGVVRLVGGDTVVPATSALYLPRCSLRPACAGPPKRQAGGIWVADKPSRCAHSSGSMLFGVPRPAWPARVHPASPQSAPAATLALAPRLLEQAHAPSAPVTGGTLSEADRAVLSLAKAIAADVSSVTVRPTRTCTAAIVLCCYAAARVTQACTLGKSTRMIATLRVRGHDVAPRVRGRVACVAV